MDAKGALAAINLTHLSSGTCPRASYCRYAFAWCVSLCAVLSACGDADTPSLDIAARVDTVLDAVDRLRQKVRNMRKTGLETTGQYAVENLAFKVLRRSGELDRLADLKAKAYDETLSLPE